MASSSRIEWTQTTWNPVTGCSKTSAGCKFCYAEVMARRLRAMGVERYRDGFEVTLQPDLLDAPSRWRKPRLVFVNSMSDLFHEAVPGRYIQRVFAAMESTPRHTFQVLTKRAQRLEAMAADLPWPDNIWMGVSVENQLHTDRVRHLQKVPARVRFLSVEPLLESIPNLPLAGIHWVIVGGESGRRPRPVKIEWVRELRDQCLKADIPFFFKQWGGTNKKKSGRELDGRTWDQMPLDVSPMAAR